MKKIVISTLFFAGMLMFSTTMAAEHDIKMLNKGKDGLFVFETNFLKIAKSDTSGFFIKEDVQRLRNKKHDYCTD